MTELTALSARAAIALLRRGEVTPLDLIDAAEARIRAVDGAVNALPTPCLDRARDHARRLMARAPDDRGPLAGLPLAIKDLDDVAGVRTTYGSPIYADHIPARSNVFVETLEERGGIVIAKSNTPEFGAGANTFNEVFGKTLNPWDRRLTCGGSSGGAAVALATGQAWLASGSDLGGSLRTPASFCGVVGLRPSPGRVATGPDPLPFDTLAVTGPMARDVGDVALMLDAMAGARRADPRCLPAPERPFLAAIEATEPPRRVAFSPDLGITPVEAEVAAICARAADRFADMGAEVEAAHPDFSDAPETFQTLRAARFAAGKAPLLATERARLKPEVVWNIEKGLALDGDAIGAAMRARGALYHRVVAFFDDYDLLVCPAAIVPPFDVDQRYVAEVGGHKFDDYVAWLAITFVLTLTSCPVLCLPAGFTEAGLPVGIQIMGPPRGEARVLAAGALFEAAAGLAPLTPIEPRDRATPRPARA